MVNRTVLENIPSISVNNNCAVADIQSQLKNDVRSTEKKVNYYNSYMPLDEYIIFH